MSHYIVNPIENKLPNLLAPSIFLGVLVKKNLYEHDTVMNLSNVNTPEIPINTIQEVKLT